MPVAAVLTSPAMSVTSPTPWPHRVFGSWVADVNAATLRSDAQAALLAAVLVLPQGIAFAALAGLPPVWGLYAGVVPAAVAALAGSSRHVVTGPTNALALAVGAALAPLAAAGSAEYLRLALVLTLMVGLVQVAVALTRLGGLTHFISPSVLLGFTTGAAVLIGWSALPDLGLRLRDAATDYGLLQGAAAAVGALTLMLALLARRLWPHGPGLLLALAGGTLAGWLLHRLAGVELPRVGLLPAVWPPLAWPDVQAGDVPRLATIALALTLVALGQNMAIAKALAQRSGQVLDVNRECLGQGLANTLGACASSFVACGSLNRSLPVMLAGSRTPLAGVMAALALLVLAAVAAPVLAWIPFAAIAGVLLLVAWGLIDRCAWRELLRLDQRETAVAAGTALAMLVVPLQVAVLCGVAASLVVYLYRTAHPALRTMGFAEPVSPGGASAVRPFVVLAPGAPECPQLKLLRMEGSVWFGAEAHVADTLRALRQAPSPQPHLLVMTKSMNFVDPAGAAMWQRELVERRSAGGDLYFHRPRPKVLAIWQRGGFVEQLGTDHLFNDKRSAIAAIVPRLDGSVCAGCRARVFEECARQPGGSG